MQHIHEGDLCPELPPADDSGAASDAPLSSGVINGPSGSSGNAAFNGASAGLALAVFMAEMVSQVCLCTSAHPFTSNLHAVG